MMEKLRKGYKQTDIGIIPEDWEVVQIKDFSQVLTGGTPSTLIPIYWGGNILWMSSGELNYKHVRDVVGRITQYGLDNSSTRRIPANCVLIGLAGQGKTRGTAAINLIELCTNQSIAAILPSSKHDSFYLYHSIDDRYNELRELSTGDGGRGGLNKRLLENLFIALPHPVEQQAIASTLNDMDSLIEALDKKIAKKRAIKEGAMQQLLTGKKRLAGFTEPWVEKMLENIVLKFLNGGTPSTNIPNHWSGNIPWITGADFDNHKINNIRRFITKDAVSNSSTNIVSKGNLLIVTRTGVGKMAIAPFDVAISQDITGLYLKEDINPQYVLCYLEYNSALLTSLNQGTSISGITREVFEKVLLLLPPTLSEQQAIARILTDMNDEIEQLEKERQKYIALKQGAMQKLLTGQIRLVNTSSQHRAIPIATHIIGGHIVNILYGSKGWGRTKLQKSMHLVGYCCQLDFGNEYIRNTAGPDDQLLMKHIDDKFKQYRHIRIETKRDSRGGKHYDYIPTPMITELEQVFETYPTEIKQTINDLLTKIKKMDLARAEIVSTLYAVWNNRIIKGQSINDDDLLLKDFYDWSEHKSDFSQDLVLRGLNYMRQEGIIPIGWGKYIDKKSKKS
jgi:type I restriction enzyme S subunit